MIRILKYLLTGPSLILYTDNNSHPLSFNVSLLQSKNVKEIGGYLQSLLRNLMPRDGL